MSDKVSHDADALEERLDEYLDAILSSRRTARRPALDLSDFSYAEQEFVLHWIDVISRSNAEMAYQVAAHSPKALRAMAMDDVERWIIHVMDEFDREGLYRGCHAISRLDQFIGEVQAQETSIRLEDIARQLESFICGLSGRPLKLEEGETTFTDTEKVFLPPRLAVMPSREENYLVYKAMAVFLWAQTRFGTFRSELPAFVQSFHDSEVALQLFHRLETLRLEACIKRLLPGLYRDFSALPMAADWKAQEFPALAVEALVAEDADIATTYHWVRECYGKIPVPEAILIHGSLQPEMAEAIQNLRKAKEKQTLQEILARLEAEASDEKEDAKESSKERNFEVSHEVDAFENFSFELMLDGKPMPPPEDASAVLTSVLLDFGEIPPEYLHAAGGGGYADASQKDAADVWKGTYHEEGAFIYNEWDFRRRHFRKNWCVLRELDVNPVKGDFVSRTLRKHRGLIMKLRHTFEAIRGEDKLLRRQYDGEEIDFDALIEARAELSRGMEMPDQVYTKMSKTERNIAVMFMVDMSGSTEGWINDAERESLVLLCEALEILGDRYAIYGFSGQTRKRCEVYRVKKFDEPYGAVVRERITGIRPKDYTRMGVTIRHLTAMLNDVEAKTKLLITLSDGKPDDYDEYRGEYGIEDTRQALVEAKYCGIHPFCITIDTEAGEYLPHMYGAVNYTVIDDVGRLPLKVADIYRQLTI